ncbi:receptor like protein 9 [Rhynchospora pubera]|uniref:Receptor like protein 9 n=1 Tax=Rhynchospora pubera TaxID=906938 RepID=A0AAV8HES5_9POAL|nr:receptor like protein 9 [Rhynchospora pubera]
MGLPSLSPLIVVVLLLWQQSEGCGACWVEEKAALLDIKASFSVNPGTTWQLNWDNGDDCCKWQGVTCDSVEGWITSLDLRQTSVNLTPRLLNSTLFLPFQELNNLSLAENFFNCCVPGSGFESWSSLSKLEVLDIRRNNFNDCNIKSLVRISSLKTLLISQNQLSDVLQIKQLSALNLEVLDLSGNKISGIISDLGYWPFLKALSLRVNLLNMGRLCKVGMLQELDLSQNEFTGELPACIRNLTSLTYLDLSNNHLQMKFPTPVFADLTSLVYLSLSGNQLEGLLLLSSFSNYSKLKILELSSQSGALPLGFSYLQLIFVLDISYNNISDHIENALQGNLTSLHSLYLSNNSFYGSLPNLVKARRMIDFVLDGNLITGKIPDSICNVSLLTFIDLSNNRLNGRLPSCLSQISKLEILNLGGNVLEGALPTSICSMQYLQFLDLSRNNFSESFPSCLNISNLQFLHLSQNSFSGTFPIGLSNSPNLRTIDISGNEFSGTLPKWINGTFVKLRVLLLKGNEFEGPIPNQICQLKHLLVLDLSHNSLSGQIPSCLSSMGSEGAFYSFQYANTYGSGSALIMPYYEFLLDNKMKTYGVGSIGVDQEEFMTKRRSDYSRETTSIIFLV